MVALAAATLIPACSGEDDPTKCEAGIKVKAEAMGTAVDALVKVSGEMKAKLAVACTAIAKDLGATGVKEVGDGKSVSDDDMKANCMLASTALNTAVASAKAAGAFSIAVQGGQCRVNASAQLSCEGSCSADAQCQGGTVELRCSPGELSVKCAGTCKAMATCQGSATVAAKCTGECAATCKGTCMGTCTGKCDAADSMGTCAGMCDGECTGTCMGTCSGDCKITAAAGVTCDGEASCKGGCEGTATAPKCEGKLTEPTCMIDADCKAACDGQAEFDATCEPITVVVVAKGNAMLEATLKANYGAIFEVLKKTTLAVEASGRVATSAVAVGEAVLNSTGCVATLGASLTAKFQAAASASVSVSASASASGSVSSSAGG